MLPLLCCFLLVAGDNPKNLAKPQAEALARLAEALGPFDVRLTVVVRSSDFDDKGLATLAPLLKKLPAVAMADLSRARVTPEGVKASFAEPASVWAVALPRSLQARDEMKELCLAAPLGFYLFPVAYDPTGPIAFAAPQLDRKGEGPKPAGPRKTWSGASLSAEELGAMAAVEQAGGELTPRFEFTNVKKGLTDAELRKLLPQLKVLPAGSVSLKLNETAVTAAGLKGLIGVLSLGHLALPGDLYKNERLLIAEMQQANPKLSVSGAMANLSGVTFSGTNPAGTAPKPTKP